MIRRAQVGQLGGPVTMLYIGVGFIQSVSSSGGTFNVLVEFRKHYFQVSMIKVPRDHMHCFWVFVLQPAKSIVQVAKSYASVSIRRYVHSSHHDNGKLTRKVHGPASNRDKFQVCRAVPVDNSGICAPAVVHIDAEPPSSALTGCYVALLAVGGGRALDRALLITDEEEYF